MQGDVDTLFELNRSKLKKVFNKHFPNKEGRMTYSEFCTFCKNSRIHPDLVSMLELKRVVVRVSSITQTNKITLSYAQFEHTLKHIAVATFNSSIPLEDKLRMLLIHIKNPCKQEYQVSLSCSASDQTPSHSSDLEGSQHLDDSKSKKERALRVTLDLSASIKTPKGRPKFLSTSPGRNRAITIPTRPDPPALQSPKYALRGKEVPLFHVSLDKQKHQPRQSAPAEKTHTRTLSVGDTQSPRFGAEGKGEDEARTITDESRISKKEQGTSPTPASTVSEVRATVQSLHEKMKALQPAHRLPSAPTLAQNRHFIAQTTSHWFSPVRSTQCFVQSMILSAWRDLARRHRKSRV